MPTSGSYTDDWPYGFGEFEDAWIHSAQYARDLAGNSLGEFVVNPPADYDVWVTTSDPNLITHPSSLYNMTRAQVTANTGGQFNHALIVFDFAYGLDLGEAFLIPNTDAFFALFDPGPYPAISELLVATGDSFVTNNPQGGLWGPLNTASSNYVPPTRTDITLYLNVVFLATVASAQDEEWVLASLPPSMWTARSYLNPVTLNSGATHAYAMPQLVGGVPLTQTQLNALTVVADLGGFHDWTLGSNSNNTATTRTPPDGLVFTLPLSAFDAASGTMALLLIPKSELTNTISIATGGNATCSIFYASAVVNYQPHTAWQLQYTYTPPTNLMGSIADVRVSFDL